MKQHSFAPSEPARWLLALASLGLGACNAITGLEPGELGDPFGSHAPGDGSGEGGDDGGNGGDDGGHEGGGSAATGSSQGDLFISTDSGSGEGGAAGSPTPGPPGIAWAKRFGNGAQQRATGVAVDALGNVVLVGDFEGMVDFGGGWLASAGSGTDVFVAKLDGEGQHVWSKRFGGPGNQGARSVAVEADGDVLVAGRLDGLLDGLPGSPCGDNTGMNDGFAAKLDANGTPVAKWCFGYLNDFCAANAIAATKSAIIVAGVYGGCALEKCGDGYNAFLRWLDPGFSPLDRDYYLAAPGEQAALAVAASPNGLVASAGHFAGSAEFPNGSTLATATTGDGDAYVTLQPASGDKSSYKWVKRFGDALTQKATAVAFGSGDDVIVAGTFTGYIDFGAGALKSLTQQDVFVARLALGNAAPLWSKRFGGDTGNATATATSLATDAAGNVVVAGYYSGSIDFGLGPLASEGGTFVAKLDGTGKPLWNYRFGGTSDYPPAVATAPDGAVLVAGAFHGLADFGGVALQSEGQSDIFVVKIVEQDGGPQ